MGVKVLVYPDGGIHHQSYTPNQWQMDKQPDGTVDIKPTWRLNQGAKGLKIVEASDYKVPQDMLPTGEVERNARCTYVELADSKDRKFFMEVANYAKYLADTVEVKLRGNLRLASNSGFIHVVEV